MTETSLEIAEDIKDIPPNSASLGIYSKEKLLKAIEEFPDLRHPLPVYKFLYWTGEVYTTVDLPSFAKNNDLNLTQLRKIHTYSGSHKGLIKCPDNITTSLERNRELHQSILKSTNQWFNKK